ncbi:MAG: prepilin-type N-terminal cleavage/methylation domain-containing protein [Lachnospiraceae bacterium]|nr:prepilin-type N-terminal cleavage/methylation domain-containing protein [Lachnospiraceae bacterium]
MVDNKFKKKELNNQGVTLVELLVAVAIIGIIVGPFLHAFVSSIQTNSKARNSLRATTVAQDIVEGIKAYGIEELGYQFNFPDTGFHVIHNGSVSGGSVEEVLYSGGAYTSVDPTLMPANPLTDLHASVYSGDSGNTYTFLGQNSGIYYFTMSNISFENKKYDALITLSANSYKAGGTSTVSPNEEPVVTIDKMDNFKDAYYVQKTGMDAEAVTKLNESLGPGNSILQADVSRTFTIDISNTLVSGKPDLTKVSVSYNYVGTFTGDPTQSRNYNKEATTIFNNKISGEKLTHIYFFYYALYSDWKSDNIVIKNNDNVPVVVHLVKQMDSLKSYTSLENTYHMNLSVQENNNIGMVTNAVTSFQTNLNVNMTNQLPVNQANVTFNGMNCNLSDLEAHGIVKKEKKDRLFDIYVDVYQEGSASAGFPSDKKLVSFDSSKQD